MPHADLTVIPLGGPSPSVGAYIAEIQRHLASQDRVSWEMRAMGTTMEGSVDDLMAVAAKLHSIPFEHGIPRVYSILKLDERRDKQMSLQDKVDSVQRHVDSSPG